MAQTNGETNISLGDITERAEKLEAEKPAAEEKAEEKKAETPAPEAKKSEVPAKTEPEKKAPNDPDELRKWNTKVSMELAEVRKQSVETQKQLQVLADILNKTSKKQVDWKDLAKDPAKLEAAVEAQKKELDNEWQNKIEAQKAEHYTEITASERERRKHDDAYPRWSELLPHMQSMALKADSRIDFTKHPKVVLDQMYEVAQQDQPSGEKPAASAAAKGYTEAELQAKIAEATAKAVAEAQKGLKAEEQGAGIGSMGKGAPKGGSSDAVKKAAWAAPLNDLKSAIQRASENR